VASLPYSKDVENRIRKLIRKGVAVKVILDSIQDLQDAPKSLQSMYTKYGWAIADERARLHEYLGEVALEEIANGNSKILELALRAKAGWNPTSVTQEKTEDDMDEDQDPIEILMDKLSKRTSSSGDSPSEDS